ATPRAAASNFYRYIASQDRHKKTTPLAASSTPASAAGYPDTANASCASCASASGKLNNAIERVKRGSPQRRIGDFHNAHSQAAPTCDRRISGVWSTVDNESFSLLPNH